MKKLLLASALYISALCASQSQEIALGYNNACMGTTANFCVLKTAGGLVYAINVTTTAAAYVGIYDQATAPSGVQTPIFMQFVASAGTTTISYIPGALRTFNGITVGCSTVVPTSAFTGSNCFVSGLTQ